MGKSRTGLIATGIEVVTFIFVIVAFSTPNWLETDKALPKPKFQNLGELYSNFSVEFSIQIILQTLGVQHKREMV